MIKPHYITPKERIGYFLLIILILVGHSLYFFYDRLYGIRIEDQKKIVQEIVNEEIEQLSNLRKTRRIALKNLKPFDPNKIPIDSLAQYGLSKYVINNLDKYRQAGGTIKSESDLLKIYGIDTSNLNKINHLLVIPKPETANRKTKKTTFIHNPEEKNNAIVIKTKQNEYKKEIFDPNTADIATLRNKGFSKYAANNLIKYRSKGGMINESKDLLKIYGVDSSLIQGLEKFIVIHKPKTNVSAKAKVALPDSNYQLKQEKVNDVLFDLNTVTQEELISLKGIGPIISKNIIEYRSKLGGFYKVDQLNEVYGISPELFELTKNRLSIPQLPQQVYIPSLTFKELLKHPYTDFESTKLLKNISILDFEEKIKTLIANGSLDQRLIPYLLLKDPLSIQKENDH